LQDLDREAVLPKWLKGYVTTGHADLGPLWGSIGGQSSAFSRCFEGLDSASGWLSLVEFFCDRLKRLMRVIYINRRRLTDIGTMREFIAVIAYGFESLLELFRQLWPQQGLQASQPLKLAYLRYQTLADGVKNLEAIVLAKGFAGLSKRRAQLIYECSLERCCHINQRDVGEKAVKLLEGSIDLSGGTRLFVSRLNDAEPNTVVSKRLAHCAIFGRGQNTQ
jgi:hypothetical protein